MPKTLRDLLDLDDPGEPKAASPPLPSPAICAGDLEVTPEVLPGTSTGVSSDEAATTGSLLDLLQSLTPVSGANSPADSLEKQDSKISPKSSDFIVFERSNFAERSPDSEESKGSKSNKELSYSLETESFLTAEKSQCSSDQESSKPGDISLDFLKKEIPESTEKPPDSLLQESSKSVEKCLNSPDKGEASKQKDSSPASAPEKSKKTVRLLSNENVADNVNAGRFTALKPCPSVGTNLEIFDVNISPGIRLNGGGHLVSPESSTMVEEAWERLKKSYVYFKGRPVGTLAAMDPSADSLNYNQVFFLLAFFFLFEQ